MAAAAVVVVVVVVVVVMCKAFRCVGVRHEFSDILHTHTHTHTPTMFTPADISISPRPFKKEAPVSAAGRAAAYDTPVPFKVLSVGDLLLQVTQPS